MSNKLLTIALIATFLLGAASCFFTHKYWCPCPHPIAINSIHEITPVIAVQGKKLDSSDHGILAASRKQYPHNAVVDNIEHLEPIAATTVPCPDYSNKIDTNITWHETDTSNKIIDSGVYHVHFINDCLYGRTLDLFVESTPHHAPPSAEHSHSVISTGVLEAIGKADKWIRLALFLEHDFFKGNYTLGLRAHIDLGVFHLYGAAALGAQNLPVGIEYDIWK